MKKEKIKNIVLIIVVAVISSTVTSFATSNYLYDSIDVKYDNSNGVQAETVQGAIDELYSCATNYNEIRNMIYPVGSIYISVTDDTVAKVQARFGGTWEAFGKGKTLVGVDTSDTSFNTIEKTGGNKNHSITVNELPVHNHSIPSLTVNSAEVSAVLPINSTTAGDYTGWTYDTSTVTYVSKKGGLSVVDGKTSTTTTVASSTNGCTNCLGSSFSIQNPYITVYMYKRVS